MAVGESALEPGSPKCLKRSIPHAEASPGPQFQAWPDPLRQELELDTNTVGLEIRRVPLDELHQDPSNARLHDARNLDSICASLQRFGQAEPLVVQRGSGRVVGGNGRLEAMKSLGWTEDKRF